MLGVLYECIRILRCSSVFMDFTSECYKLYANYLLVFLKVYVIILHL